MNQTPFDYYTKQFDEFQEWWKKLREEMANWLNQWDWDWWATFTFRFRTNPYNAGKYFVKFFEPWNPDYFYAVEWFQFNTNVHIHALMRKCAKYRRMDVVDMWWWRYGKATVYPYQKEKGARWYLCKYIVKSLADWNFKISD